MGCRADGGRSSENSQTGKTPQQRTTLYSYGLDRRAGTTSKL